MKGVLTVGKCGNCVSMKDMMRMEMAEVTEVLDRHDISGEDRAIVTAVLKEAFYQWANTNAVACVFEEYIETADKDLYMQASNPARNMAAVMKKMAETYPEEWCELPEVEE